MANGSMKKIGEGAEAVIYSSKIYGNDIIVKSREPKKYRLKEFDIRLRRFRTKKEAKIINKAANANISVPKIIAVGETTIMMSRINGKLLKDIKITKNHMQKSGELLAKLHNSNIAHGDFTPANIISSGNDVFIIDFGLADQTSSNEDKALDVLLMKRQLSSSFYKDFIRAYSKNSKSQKEILSRLASIEERGRYQSRTLV